MSEGRDRLIIDLDRDQIYKRFFFIEREYIDFWLDNTGFRSEYNRLNQCGIKDGFYLFSLAAQNTFAQMKNQASAETDPAFDFGFAHKSLEEMERRLQRGYDDRVSDPRLNFLVNRLAAPEYSIRYWLMVPEFVSAMQALLPQDIKITNQVVYPVMRSIYESKKDLKSNSDSEDSPVSFNLALARKAIRMLEKKLKIPDDDRLK